MSGNVLILRPEPAASATAAAAAALGLEPVVAPLFTVAPLAWSPPDPADYDALLLTSANAARHAVAAIAAFRHLPCYAVGPATAAAAREAGLGVTAVGPSDGAAAAALMAEHGRSRVLHLCGRDHIALSHPGLNLEQVPVYASEAATALPEAAAQAIAAGALVLLHSPRAGSLLADLVPERDTVRLAAISAAAAAAAGEGWASKSVASAPRDEALLELAAKLCNIARPGERGVSG